MELEDKKKAFLEILEAIGEHTPAKAKQEVFLFLRRYWTELGEDETIAEKVCAKLSLSKHQFNLFINNADLVYGAETLNKNLKDGWLKNYLEYTSNNEAPEDFHLWTGLTILGAALRRRVYYEGGHFRLYPNLYTILVSPPGVGKKTTAIRIGTNILSTAIPDLKIISEKITPEALARRLSKPVDKKKSSGGLKTEACAEGLAIAPELTVFLGREQYNEGLIVLLTRLYDCDKVDTETIGRGIEPIRDVWFAMLGGTTPSEISKAIPASAGGGGLMSRLNIIYRETTPRTFPFPVEVDNTMRELLINELARINKDLAGPVTMTPDGREWWGNFYIKNKADMETPGHMHLERQGDQLTKLAIIMMASEGGKMQLDADILQRSHNILNVSKRNITDITKLVDTDDRAKSAQHLLNIIRKFGGRINRTNLVKYSYHKIGDVFHVQNALNTLLEAELIVEKKGTRTSHTYYTLKAFDDKVGDD